LPNSSISISSFAVGNDNELYVLDFAAGTIFEVISAP